MMNELDKLRYVYLVSSAVTDYRLKKAGSFIFMTVLCLCIMIPSAFWGFLIGHMMVCAVSGVFSIVMMASIFATMMYKDNLIRQDTELYCETVRHLRSVNYPMENFYEMNLVQ